MKNPGDECAKAEVVSESEKLREGSKSGSMTSTSLLWSKDDLPGYLTAAAFSRDGSILAAGSAHQHGILLWNATDGREKGQMLDLPGGVTCLSFSPTDSLLASGCEDCTVRVWDLAESRLVAVLRGHEGGITDVQFGRNGRVSDQLQCRWNCTYMECYDMGNNLHTQAFLGRRERGFTPWRRR